MLFTTQEKTKWKFIGIVLVLAIVAGTGILWCAEKEKIPLIELLDMKDLETVEDKNTEFISSQVEGWETYSNKEHGFEIDYPYYLENIKHNTESLEAFFPLKNEDVFLEKVFSIHINEEEYDQGTKYYCDQGIPHASQTIINGVNLCEVRSPEDIENNMAIHRSSYFVIHNKKWISFNLTLSYCVSKDCVRPSEFDIAKKRKNFKQIISTLRFLEEEAEDEAEKSEQIKTLKQIVYGFLGTPYERGPLGEGDNEKIYRTDVFDCTTLVLVTASKLNSNGTSPEEMMEKANYYPAGEVSYENRLHFSTYRNKVSPFFRDITFDVGGERTKEKTVILNKERDKEGRLIDIDWEEEIKLKYIEKEDIFEIISHLPLEVGVAFIVDGDEKIGLDVKHEGFVFDREKLVHASSNRGEVFEENFLDFLEKSNYSGVLFFKII